MGSTYQFGGKYFLCIQLLLFVLAFTSRLVGCEEHGDVVAITKSDYQSLVAIKKELVDSRGLLRSWGGSWSGTCSGKWAGVKCVNGSVVAIQLPWRGLGGKISEKIGQLQALRKISLHDNALTGSIPWSIGNLRNLRGIHLFNNRLSGSIPWSIGNSPILQTVDVSNNSLTGVIPSNLWSSSRLYRLNMSFNSLMGPIPVNFTLKPSLTILALQNNNLSGPIPDSWGGGVLSGKGNISSQLQFLTLDQNHLSGTIPPSLTKLHLLRELSLSNNEISGPIPASLDHFANLTSFNVSYNNLSGVVPSDLSKKFDSSSFVGNLQLCGYSSSSVCVSPSPPAIVLPSPSPEHHKNLSTKDIILIAAGALLVVMLLLCCILCCCLIRRRASAKKKNGKATSRDVARKTEKSIPAAVEVESGGEMGGKLVHFDGQFVFTADDLLCATAEIMGKSTYGTAYKATLEDGNQIAVKRLREKTTKGHREFEVEAATLGKIRHQNLLAMRAYYLGPKGEKLLVFDYMSNGSLSSFLHARGPESVISWPTRMNIAIGVARGVDYLHTGENMIHGNLTSSNVLLDEQTNPHIADFGISKLMTAAANTNVIATAGTLGYRAPELSKLKNANTKTDVYSLGVIILELLTGKSPGEPNNGMDLPQWVASIVKEEWTNEVFDLELMRDAPTISDELLNTLKLALHCVDPSPSARPEAVEVLKQLEEVNPEMPPAPISADEEHKVAIE